MKTKYLIGRDAPITKLTQTFPKEIDDSLSLGLDIGIGSCGQAIISLDEATVEALGALPNFFKNENDETTGSFIRYMGVHAFDIPEARTNTGIELKNPERRAKRLLRRGIRRRAARIFKTRNLLRREGILSKDYDINNQLWRKKHEQATPWIWRVEALTRKLSDWEWAVVLLHFAKHRGFKSNKKSDLDSKGAEGGTLQSSRINHEALQQYKSVADMMLKDKRFQQRVRNRTGDYRAMILRADLEKEIQLLFDKQKNLENPYTTERLKQHFLKIFNFQNPLQHPYVLLGDCPFEEGEKRRTRLAYSFELSRALQKLNTLTLIFPDKGEVRFIDYARNHSDSYQNFVNSFGLEKSIRWSDLRSLFDLDTSVEFLDLPTIEHKSKNKKEVQAGSKTDEERAAELKEVKKEAEKLDFVTRSTSKSCAEGTYLLRKVLGELLWSDLVQKEDWASIDNAAFCLTFFESTEAILDVLREKNSEKYLKNAQGHTPKRLPNYRVDSRVADGIQKDFESTSPQLLKFNGTVSLSAKASRNLIPYLQEGLMYSEACEKAGY